MDRHEVYFQSEGHTGTRVIELEVHATILDLVEGAKLQGLTIHEGMLLFIEDVEAEYVLAEITSHLLEDLQIGHEAKVHFHRSSRIAVTVRFEAESLNHTFRPGTTIGQIKHWAVEKLKLDASVEVDHGLKVCGQTTFLAETTHIGSLAHKDCEVCLILAPKRPVQG